MGKPDWCTREAKRVYHSLENSHVFNEIAIARALLDAHQRGKDEKEREVAALLKNSAAVRVNYLRGRIACQPLIDEAHQRGKEEGHAEGRREGMEEAAGVCDAEIEQARKFGPHHIPIISGIRQAIRAKAQEVKS